MCTARGLGKRNHDISYARYVLLKKGGAAESPAAEPRRRKWARHGHAPLHHVTCGLARPEGSALFKQSLIRMDDAFVRVTDVTLLECRDDSQACS